MFVDKFLNGSHQFSFKLETCPQELVTLRHSVQIKDVADRIIYAATRRSPTEAVVDSIAMQNLNVGHMLQPPLNVCCSEFGFCGSTSEFCHWTNAADPVYPACDTKYGGCGAVNRPQCSAGSSGSVSKRNIGYYESWSNTQKCSSVAPEDLNLDGFTHINFAFSFFDPSSLQITPMDANGASLYSRFTALKAKKSGLQTWISVGGWSFTDPGSTQKAFSIMASSRDNRSTFIQGDLQFMSTYGFDELFEQWKDKYRTLDWIATPNGYEDRIIADRRQDDAEDAREIHRAHGWPDSFGREECKEALVVWREKWYRIMCERSANPLVATS